MNIPKSAMLWLLIQPAYKNTHTFIDYKQKISIMPQNIKQSRLKFL